MTRKYKDEIEELNAFVDALEHKQIQIIDDLAFKLNDGYADQDLHRIVLFGNAIRAVKDSIAFREKLDAS
ncbi:hypothetical protein V5F77_11065 [Xanthobacter sp. DSM 24535]|uniref:hypothetical protein n=1 Tax=Roseixanthobacter psychrophilus TaxID=3119917 RepID=UPI00372CDEEB